MTPAGSLMPQAQAGRLTGFVIGYDVCGFTRAVETAREKFGASAGEMAAAGLVSGGREVAARLALAGFAPIDETGDGALYFAPCVQSASADPLESILRDVERAHLASSGLAIRTASIWGEVWTLDLQGVVPGQKALIWGEAPFAVHSALAGASRGTVVSRLEPADHARGWIADLTSGVRREATLVVRLADAEDWRKVSISRLLGGLNQIRDWCTRCEATPERISHDEKGILMRMSLRTAGEGELAAVRHLLDRLAATGFESAAALAEGPVYRGQCDQQTHVHGDAINWAAKTCATLKSRDCAVRPVEPKSFVSRDRLRGTAAMPPLIGRDTEMAEALAHCSREGPACLALCGPSGIGKTRFAGTLLAVLRTGVWASASVRCTVQTQFEPFAILRTMLRDLTQSRPEMPDRFGAWLGTVMAAAGVSTEWRADCCWLTGDALVNDGGRGGVDPGVRAYMLERFAIHALLDSARDAGLLVLVDDAHAIDPYSARALAGALEAATSNGVRMIVLQTLRPIIPGQAGAKGIGWSGQTSIDLGALPPSAIHEIAVALVPQLDRVHEAEIVRLANGSPFAAEIVSRAIAGDLDGDSQRSEQGVARLLRDRIDRLEQTEQLILRAVALARGPLDRALLVRVMARLSTFGDVDAAIARLDDEALVTCGDARTAGVAIAHDLVGATVCDSMSVGAMILVAHALARELARELDRGEREQIDPAGDLLRKGQLWQAARRPGRAAASFARSGRLLMAAGFALSAVELLQRAVDLASSSGLMRRTSPAVWQAELGEALWASGNLAAASEAADASVARLVSLRKPRRTAASLVLAGNLLAETGHFRSRIRDIAKGTLIATRHTRQGERSRLVRCRPFGMISYMSGIARMSLPPRLLLGWSIRVSRDTGDTRPEAYLRVNQAILAMVFCRWDATAVALERSLDCISAWPAERQLHDVVLTSMGHNAVFQGKFGPAATLFSLLRERAAERGNRLHLAWADYMSGLVAMNQDRFEDAGLAITAARGGLSGLGDVLSDQIVLGLEARLAWLRGNQEASLGFARAAGELSIGLAPFNFSSLEGFAAPPLFALLAAVNRGHVTPEERALINRFGPVMRRFSMIFPLARPRQAIITGLVNVLRGRTTLSAAMARAALKAEHTGMLGEAHLARTIALRI